MSGLLKIKIDAGNHERNHCPVSIIINRDLVEDIPRSVCLVDGEGNRIPAQISVENENYQLHFIIDRLSKQEQKVFQLHSEESSPSNVEIVEKDRQLDINVDGNYFTTYVYDREIAKPYLGPIAGPYESSYTRLDFETKEHPHHRSLWLAIGDVNGIDMWNEPEGRYGKQLHQEFSQIASGPVNAVIVAKNVWTDYNERPQIDETRKITIYNTPATNRFIDLDVTFTANYGKVEFGATKEAGPLGIRVAESMKVDSGGSMVNAYGSVGEEECWGQRAEWCDYVGEVEGKTLGISAFDHPRNEHFPTYWHIRNYGLLAPNNFYFIGGNLIQPGEKVNYKYRVYFHAGDTDEANVGEHYQNYINPPKVEILS